ncbi:hypothetical protein Npun_R5209 [Nostoc punctiforme PCC 73102]|uniref:Uncharacterized protein n=1 Tax=Nostoc punctiforme (strain ATCC 29133 / PCC 73102) TaxID=63737 RepID=B2J389_NOSP7|nr:hypothetical protein Npun_R5209 [Nostoc punctiforme PCC 73102]
MSFNTLLACGLSITRIFINKTTTHLKIRLIDSLGICGLKYPNQMGFDTSTALSAVEVSKLGLLVLYFHASPLQGKGSKIQGFLERED